MPGPGQEAALETLESTVRVHAGLDGLELTPLVDEELHVALPATHPLARRRRVPLIALRDERWVDGAYPDCLGPLHQLSDALGAPARIGFTCHDWQGKQALVAADRRCAPRPHRPCCSILWDLVGGGPANR